MNGIVTGKQEKQAGSLVWKSLYQHIFAWDDYTWSIELSETQPSELITLFLNHQLYLKLSPASRWNMPPSYIIAYSFHVGADNPTYFYVNQNNQWDYMRIYIVNVSVGNISFQPSNQTDAPSLSYYLTSIEFGTFE